MADELRALRPVDELLRVARDEQTRRELAAVLRKWAGMRVYMHHLDRTKPADEARRYVAAHVGRAAAVGLLVSKFSLSRAHCRRLVARAMHEREQTMRAAGQTLDAAKGTP